MAIRPTLAATLASHQQEESMWWLTAHHKHCWLQLTGRDGAGGRYKGVETWKKKAD